MEKPTKSSLYVRGKVEKHGKMVDRYRKSHHFKQENTDVLNKKS